MREKQQPTGICDLCLGEIPRGQWYTRRGPRLYHVECKNTANSRNGNPIRIAKQIERVRRGEWQNPHHLNPPTNEEQARRARLGRQREVAAGTWRNPALSDAARVKLSRPRKHRGALHRVMEKLRTLKVSELTARERSLYRAYQRDLARQRRAAQ